MHRARSKAHLGSGVISRPTDNIHDGLHVAFAQGLHLVEELLRGRMPASGEGFLSDMIGLPLKGRNIFGIAQRKR